MVAYTFSVTSVEECPISAEMVLMSPPLFNPFVPKECLAQCIWSLKGRSIFSPSAASDWLIVLVLDCLMF